MFRFRVREGLDSLDVVLWFCGWLEQHPGLSDAVENYLGHGEGDDTESNEREVVGLVKIL